MEVNEMSVKQQAEILHIKTGCDQIQSKADSIKDDNVMHQIVYCISSKFTF